MNTCGLKFKEINVYEKTITYLVGDEERTALYVEVENTDYTCTRTFTHEGSEFKLFSWMEYPTVLNYAIVGINVIIPKGGVRS